jgi:hypothetical protein
MLFVAILTHQNNDKIWNLLDDLVNQEFKNFKTFLITSDCSSDYIEKILKYPLNWLGFFQDLNFNDFGHEKRAKAIGLSNEKYTCFLNCDDRYYLSFFKKLIDKAENENLDLVFCDEKNNKWGGVLKCDVKIGKISSGGIIFKTDLAKKVGYKSRTYEADGIFVEDLVKNGAKYGKIEEILWEHN